MASSLANYQKTAEGAFSTLQSEINVQRQVYNQAIATLSADINHAVDTKVRMVREEIQNECNRELYDLNHRLQELVNRTSSEKARMQADLEAQTRNTELRMQELIENHQHELARVRSELTAANTQTLENLRREFEGRVAVAQSEVQRIQRESETALRNVEKELDRTRKDGETRFLNAKLEHEQRNSRIKQLLK